jgi:hypothetical protein
MLQQAVAASGGRLFLSEYRLSVARFVSLSPAAEVL